MYQLGSNKAALLFIGIPFVFWAPFFTTDDNYKLPNKPLDFIRVAPFEGDI